MPKIPIAFIEIRLFAHATEDPNKVTAAVKHIFPVDHQDEIEFKRTNLKGHYGNPITLFETKIKEEETVKKFINSLFSLISVPDKEDLLREFDLYVEKRSLYLRLDKQAAYSQIIRFSMKDPIRVRIRFRKSGVEHILKICREFEMLP